jgi:hypothetical protein
MVVIVQSLARLQRGRHGTSMIESAGYYYTDQLLKMLQTYPQLYSNSSGNASISFLNIHEAKSVRTTFFCHVLPDAANACQRLRLANMQEVSEEEDNKNINTSAGSTVRVPTTSIQSQTISMVRCLSDGSCSYNNDSGSRLVDTAVWKRHDVVVQAHTFQEGLKLTARDFAVKCPSKAQLDILQTASLRMEATFLLEIFETDLGESQHRLAFAKASPKRIFVVLQTTAWKYDTTHI